jgi:radical SAM superfamily enzyme YgiQ (UPF0313 family)
MLDRIQKGITLDQARNAVKICREVGLGVFLSFMAGLPGETKKTLNDTEAFAKELNVPFGYHYLAPFPGTTLREELDKFDLEVLTDDWDQYDANRAITRTSQLTRKQINEFVGQFDKEIEKCWEDMKKRYPEGKCSDAEKYKIEGDFRMRLIFQLLKEDVIEMHGFYIDNASSNNCLPGLVKRLSHILGLKAEDIEDPIADMVKSGYLNCQKDKSAIEWFWTHNLKNCNI